MGANPHSSGDSRAAPAAKFCAIFFLALFSFSRFSISANDRFHFTVTSDTHNGYTRFGKICDTINKLFGGAGAFHITLGDHVGSIQESRAVIDRYFGPNAGWYPVAGNHDLGNAYAIEWLRNEYDNGHSVRIPLSGRIKNPGPNGTTRTTYSWDYGDAHFVVLNVYWNGNAAEGTGRRKGSDTAGQGDVVPALYRWLDADLASSDKPFVFVFGHEPAFTFTQHRHEGNSLDMYRKNRDAFWKLLEDRGVAAYICGHTHRYSARKGDSRKAGNVWQFCVGSSGRQSSDGQTFLHVSVDKDMAAVSVYRDYGKGSFMKAAAFELASRRPKI